MFKKLIHLCWLLILVSGCFSYKFSPGVPVQNIASDYKNFEGKFENCTIQKGNDSISLWQIINKKAKTFLVNDYKPNQNITIKTISKKKLSICLEENNSIIACKEIKGKFIDSAFYAKKKRYFLGFPFIYLMSSGYKIMLGLDVANNLVVNANQHRFGWILIMSAGNTKEDTYIYRRVL